MCCLHFFLSVPFCSFYQMSFKIHVYPFNPASFEQWMKSPVKNFGSSTMMHSYKAGDYVVCTCNSAVVLVAKLKGVCSLRDLLDVEIYSGENAKYNKYEFPLECYWILPEPVSFETIATHCGGSIADATRTNLFKGVAMERSEVFYGKKGDSSLILDRYRCLVASWIMTSPCTKCD